MVRPLKIAPMDRHILLGVGVVGAKVGCVDPARPGPEEAVGYGAGATVGGWRDGRYELHSFQDGCTGGSSSRR